MEHIWSPWRMEYIQNENKKRQCIFCDALADQNDLENLVIYRADTAFIMLNRYPYTSGHIMIIPNQHTGILDDLGSQTLNEIMELSVKITQVLNALYHPEGFNLGMNIGKAAGAGIADHVHLHIVPRWNGDTNFMSSVGETRVLPESLDQTLYRVIQMWEKLIPPGPG